MEKITTATPAYMVGDVKVASMDVRYLSFIEFVECCDTATLRTVGSGKDFQKLVLRERIKRQVTARAADGAAIALDEASVLAMPILYARQIREIFNKDPSFNSKCKMLAKGDGVTSPLHIQLGTPLSFSNGKAITELEFMAGTLGELEDVITADTRMAQAAALLHTAKPIGVDLKLSTLPSTSLAAITLSDGFWIMNQVLPSFLGEDAE